MPAMNLRLISPELIVDIGEIAELRGIAVQGECLHIGALTRHVDLARSPEIATHAPLLTEAIAHVAHPAIRNRGTIGGSLAHADPASELPACMVALDATISCAAARRTADRGRGFLHRDLRDGAVRGRIADRRRTAGAAERIPHISSMNSRGGMATTPLSAWRRRRSCEATVLADLRLGFLCGRRSAGAGRGRQGWSTSRLRRHSCRMPRRHWRRARSPGRSAGLCRHAPASCKGAAGPLRGRAARSSRSCRGRIRRDGAHAHLARCQRRALSMRMFCRASIWRTSCANICN